MDDKPLLPHEVDQRQIPPAWKKAVYSNPELPEGAVHREWLGEHHPGITTFADVTRQHRLDWIGHIADAPAPTTGKPLGVMSRIQRISGLSQFFRDTALWQYDDVPGHTLIGAGNAPKYPQEVPRFIPEQDLDRLMPAQGRTRNRPSASRSWTSTLRRSSSTPWGSKPSRSCMRTTWANEGGTYGTVKPTGAAFLRAAASPPRDCFVQHVRIHWTVIPTASTLPLHRISHSVRAASPARTNTANEYGRIAKTLRLLRVVGPVGDTYRRQMNRQLTVQESRHKRPGTPER